MGNKVVLSVLIVFILFTSSTVNSVYAQSTPPDRIIDMTLTVVSDTQVDLNWTSPNDNGSTIEKFEIFRNLDLAGWTLLEEVFVSSLSSYSDNTLAPETTVTYMVRAVNAAGTAQAGVIPAPVTTTSGSQIPPDAITDLALTVVSDTQVDLSWSTPNDNGSPITEFLILRSLNAGPFNQIDTIVGDPTAVSFSDTTLVSGDTVTYIVQSSNGALSDVSNVPPTVTTEPAIPGKQITLRDLGILQLVAHDLFNIDRATQNNAEDGKVNLSTIFDFGTLATNGDPRNASNPVIFNAGQEFVNFFLDLRDNQGLSEEEARAQTLDFFLQEYAAAYQNLFDQPLPTPTAGDVTPTEDLAFRTLHDLIPSTITITDGGPDLNILGDPTTPISAADMLQLTAELDGTYVSEMQFLLALDISFGTELGLSPPYQDLLDEVSDGTYDPGEQGMTLIDIMSQKGLHIPPNLITDLALTTVSSTQVDLTWSTPNDHNSPITQFNISRDLNGGGMALIGTIADPALVSFSDTDLNPGDSVTYMVKASNSAGDAADSNIPSGVTTPLFIHVGDLDSTITGNKNLVAKATTTVHDSFDLPVSGVLVEGLWDDGISPNSATCTTDGTGQCTMNKNTKETSITFTVTSLSLPGLDYSAAANHDPDGDSDGTTIIITKDSDPPTDPTISINDVSNIETDSGTTSFTFTISRTGDTAGDVNVGWETADSSATTGDSDYVAASGIATILDGNPSVEITVLVNGDTTPEDDENFFVNLISSDGPAISDSQGVGTIENDDVDPSALSITSIDNNFGSPGETIIVTLTGTAFDPTANITLENGSGKTPTVNTSSITDTEIILAVVISDKGTKIGDWELTVTNPDGNSDFVIFSIVP